MSEAYDAVNYMVGERAYGEVHEERVSPTRFLKISNNYYCETQKV